MIKSKSERVQKQQYKTNMVSVCAAICHCCHRVGQSKTGLKIDTSKRRVGILQNRMLCNVNISKTDFSVLSHFCIQKNVMKLHGAQKGFVSSFLVFQ